MPAKSKKQQQFFGMVRAIQKGELSPSKVSPEMRKTAKTMKKKDVKDYAETKHTNLPKKVKKESMNWKYKLVTEFMQLGDDADEYNELFYSKLREYGVSSPDELDEESKRKLFGELDGEWESKKEKQI